MNYRFGFLAFAIFVFGYLPPVDAAAKRDTVYIVYKSSSRDFAIQLKRSFPRRQKVKTYNTDLLSMGDYSGKQKLNAILSGSGQVIVVGDAKNDLPKMENDRAIFVEGLEDDIDKIMDIIRPREK